MAAAVAAYDVNRAVKLWRYFLVQYRYAYNMLKAASEGSPASTGTGS
jgi:hypothetical protein